MPDRSDKPRFKRPRRAPKLHKNSGTYYAVFYDPDRAKPRKWVNLKTGDKRRAQRSFDAAEAAYLAGTYNPWRDELNRKLTVRQAVELYLVEAERRGMREGSLKWRRDFFNRFARELPAGELVRHVRTADVEAYIHRPPARNAKHSKNRRQLSAHTKRTYYSQLDAFFSWCLEERLVEANPVAELDRPKARRKSRIDHMTPDELEAFYRAVEAERTLVEAKVKARGSELPYPRSIVWIDDVVRFAVGTGFRLGEIVRLRWRDVDLEAGLLFVENTDAGEVKTEAGIRDVPIVPFVREVLERAAELRGDEDLDSPVFRSPASGMYGKGTLPLSADTTSRAFRKFRDKIGVSSDVSFHALRRTCGVVLASAGVPMKMIQKILGHASMSTTAAIYADVWNEELAAEMNRAFQRLSSSHE